MASFSHIFLLLSIFTISMINAQTPKAPAPAVVKPGPINITAILEKPGQYSTFIRLLIQSQVANQINNQVNTSTEGLTVLAPTDNAFQNLPSGALNKLTAQQQVTVLLYHILPKFYSLDSLETVSNPVRTQATGEDGTLFGLNFTGQANQLNVSAGLINTQIYNTLRKDFPLAVYQLDRVLLPDFSSVKAPAPAKSPPAAKGNTTKGNTTNAENTTADEPSPADNGSGKMNVGFGLVFGFLLLCIGIMS